MFAHGVHSDDKYQLKVNIFRIEWISQCMRWDFRSRKFVNTLRQRQHGRHFTDDTFKCIFLNENVIISIKISLKFVPKDPITNIPALVQIMAWRRPGDKPLSEAMMVSLLTHICVTRPQCRVSGENGNSFSFGFLFTIRKLISDVAQTLQPPDDCEKATDVC